MSTITDMADKAFVVGVIETMRKEKIGLEPAIKRFGEVCRSVAAPFAAVLGKTDEIEADIERGAKLARETVTKAREVVELADQPAKVACLLCSVPGGQRVYH